jgi:hypothetical protein
MSSSTTGHIQYLSHLHVSQFLEDPMEESYLPLGISYLLVYNVTIFGHKLSILLHRTHPSL